MKLDVACKALFDAYDVNRSGRIEREHFVHIDMGQTFDRGETYDVRPRPLSSSGHFYSTLSSPNGHEKV